MSRTVTPVASSPALSNPASALRELERGAPAFLQQLASLVRIPSVSAEGHPPETLRRSAEAVGAVLEAAGLEHVEILELPGVHPYVCADWLHAEGAPTVLFYSHHDVQPAGREELWRSAPFEAEEREGRLYGRGTADDKGGILAQVAAIASTLRTEGGLPCNLRMLVDGEEEVGSPHLGGLIAQHRERFAADVVVVTDTPNPAPGVPGITGSLRGNCIVDLEVRTLSQPMHSGRVGGAAPDPVQVLSRILAGLQREDGRLDVPGLYRPARLATRAQRDAIRALPLTEAQFRDEVGMLDGVSLSKEHGRTPYEQLWTRPAITVIGIGAPALTGTSNQMADCARARLSMRTVPELESAAAGELLVRRLTSDPPYGAQVTARVVRTVPWWRADTGSGAYQAARRALRAGYGVEPLAIGAGGSIGFMGAFARAFGRLPCLLLGIEDSASNVHSENESLLLDDWRKCARSLVHLLIELGSNRDG